MAVVAAGASAEPVPTSVGTAKTEANRCRLQAKLARGRGSDRRWRRMQKHEFFYHPVVDAMCEKTGRRHRVSPCT